MQYNSSLLWLVYEHACGQNIAVLLHLPAHLQFVMISIRLVFFMRLEVCVVASCGHLECEFVTPQTPARISINDNITVHTNALKNALKH